MEHIGDVNFLKIAKAIKEIRYDGYLIAETRPYKYYNEQQIVHTANAMKKFFEV